MTVQEVRVDPELDDREFTAPAPPASSTTGPESGDAPPDSSGS